MPIMKSGIYKLVIGSAYYYGQAVDLRGRLKGHLYHLRHGTHFNPRLQKAFNKHGEAAMMFIVRERCPVNELDDREQEYLDVYCGDRLCANVCATARTRRGVPQSPEARAKISAFQRGRRRCPEGVAKAAAAQRGTKRPHAKVHRMALVVTYESGVQEAFASQREMADALGIKQGQVSEWVRGVKRIPSKYGIKEISK